MYRFIKVKPYKSLHAYTESNNPSNPIGPKELATKIRL